MLPSALFENLQKNAENNKDINVDLHAIFKEIEASAKGVESEDDLAGLFDFFTIK